MKALLATLVLVLFLIPAKAGDSDYTLRADGLYYDAAGAAYTRKDNWEKVWYPATSYTYCGRCYQTAGYYQYKFTGYTYQAMAPALPSSDDPAWRSKLIDLAAYQQKFEAKLLLSANEHNQYLEAVRELGLTGYLRGYTGPLPALATPFRNTYSAYGVSGNTLYGYYQNTSVADIYGGADANLLFQQAAALGKDSLVMADAAGARFGGLLDKERDRASRLGEILAKGQSAAQALNAAGAAPSATIRTTESGNYPILPRGPQQQLTPKRLGAMQSCLQCHGDQDPKGGYRVSQHWSLPAERQLEAVRRMTLDPRDKDFMPRGGARQPSTVIMEFLPAEDRARLGQ